MALLQKACQRHQLGYQDAMCGKGIDRHLFCLLVVSKYLELKSPFLENAVLNAKWQLSTSQTPHGQTSKMDLVSGNSNLIKMVKIISMKFLEKTSRLHQCWRRIWTSS